MKIDSNFFIIALWVSLSVNVIFTTSIALQLSSVSTNVTRYIAGPNAILPGADRRIEELSRKIENLESKILDE